VVASEIKVDSHVITVKLKVGQDMNDDTKDVEELCKVDSVQQKYSPVKVAFKHFDHHTSKRKLLWHQNDMQTQVWTIHGSKFKLQIGT
jgi:hypothetical protein